MSLVALAARLALALLFTVAAAAKLTDRAGTRSAVLGFGAPAWAAGPLVLLLPLCELVVAALLLFPSTVIAGAIGALVLLAIFSVAIGWNLARGRSPECNCFGQLHSAPVSSKTLLRNGLLAVVGVFVLAASLTEPSRSAVAWIGGPQGAEILALAVAVAALAVVAIGAVAFLSLMRSYGQVLVRLDRVERALAEAGIDIDRIDEMPEIGLEPGAPVPAFWARSVTGEAISVETLGSSRVPTLLLFTSPNCGPCKSLLPTVAEWQREHTDRLTVVIASSGSTDEVLAEAEGHELDHVLVDEDSRLYALFEANGTPSGVLVSPDGTIASWVASGSEWIEQLVVEFLGGAETVHGLPQGAEAPPLALPSLDGETVSLTDLRGRDAVLLFWNPDCGYCRGMHNDVLAWEVSANGVHPRLVVVSSGDAESTRAEGFKSLVLLDGGFTAGEALGANGTPMAVRLDAEGRIASGVVAGAEAVFELANAPVLV